MESTALSSLDMSTIDTTVIDQEGMSSFNTTFIIELVTKCNVCTFDRNVFLDGNEVFSLLFIVAS
jgi:hypothetical protein